MKKVLLSALLLLSFGGLTAQTLYTSIDSSAAPICGNTAEWLVQQNNAYYGSAGHPQISTVFPSTQGGGPFFTAQDSFPDSLIVQCGMFRLYYQDFLFTAQPAGFMHPIYGQDAQNTMCAVLAYVESVFDIQDTIDLYIDRSWTAVINPAPVGTGALAFAGPYYVPNTFGVNPGIYGGNIYDHITTHIDPDTNNYDGSIKVNFDTYYINSNAFGILYEADWQAPTSACLFDLYTVLLHEVMHGLGWVSAITEDPFSSNNNAMSFAGDSCFTLYDWTFLYYGDILNPASFSGQKLVNGTTSSPFLNPFINTNVDPIRSNRIWLNDDATPVNQAVYSGVSDPFYPLMPGSLLHHLNYQILSFDTMNQYSPGFRVSYAIAPGIAKTERRRAFSLQEIRALLEMGYTLNPVFAAATTLNGVERNDSLLLNNIPAFRSDIANIVSDYEDEHFEEHRPVDYTMVNNNTPSNTTLSQLIIDLTLDTTLRDNNGDPVSIMPNSLIGLRGVSLNGNNHARLQVDTTGTLITYMPEPGFWGRAQFSFYLWDGHEQGAFEVITIDVQRGSWTPPFGSNLIINGGFEDGTEVRQDSLSPNVQNTSMFFQVYEGEPFVGTHLAGGHLNGARAMPYNIGAGFTVHNAYITCIFSPPIENYGAGTNAWTWWQNTEHISPGPNLNDRFAAVSRFLGPVQHSLFSTLMTPAQPCSTYVLEYDVNLWRGNTVGAVTVGDTITIITDFIANPTNFATFSVLHSHTMEFIVDSLDDTYWQHVIDTVTYCATTPADYIASYRITPFTNANNNPRLDNLSLRQIVPAALTIVADNDSTTVDPGTTAYFCPGETLTLRGVVLNGKCNVDFIWPDSTALGDSLVITPTQDTIITLLVTDCPDSTTATFTLIMNPNLPTADAGTDAAICPGQSIVIGEQQQPNLAILWSPSSTLNNDTVNNPLASPTATTNYIITVTDGNGCSNTDTVTVTVLNSAICSACLVPNPGFDTLLSCPDDLSQLSLASTWSWATLGSSDLDNSCAPVASNVNVPNNMIFGNVPVMVNPPGGNGYAGIRTFGTAGNNSREYLETRLTCKLDSGQRYQLGFYARSAPNCTNGYNNIGMHVSVNPAYAANSVTPLNLTPQINRATPIVDADGWTFVGDTIPGNNERYITIGNFFNDASTTSANNGTGGTLGFGYYFVDNVTAKPIPPVVMASKTLICAGQCVTLTASGSPAYTWTDGTNTYNGNPIQVCPITTTTYTVSAVLSCTNCDPVDTTITITVNPPPTVTATASPDTTCAGSQIQLSASVTGTGTITYVWQPPTGLNSNTISNPSISSYNGLPITYTVIITDALGCSALDSVHIEPDPNCCIAQQYAPDTLFSGMTGGSLAVNQDLYISGVVTMTNVELIMAPNVSVILLPGSTFALTGQSYEHACLQMWKGHVLNSNSTLIITGNSLVEDAYNVVSNMSAPGANVQLVDAIFNKNDTVASAEGWTGTLNFNMRGCRVTCRTLPSNPTTAMLTQAFLTAQPTTTMLPPLNNQRSSMAVSAVDGGNIIVGVGLANSENIFDNIDYGLVPKNADLESYNNHFQNMLRPCVSVNCQPATGIAIFANDPGLAVGNAATYNRITIGGLGLLANTFTDCWRSIDITRYVQYNITYNTIYSGATVISPPNLVNLNGDHGVFIRTSYSTQMNLNNNLVHNQARPIHVSLTAGGLGYNTINIRDNVVKADVTSTTFSNSGIQVDGVSGVFFVANNYLNIAGDSVLDANVCIQVRNIRNGVRVYSNPELRVRPNPTTTTGPDKAGIAIANCNAILIQDNFDIHSTGTALDSNNRNIYGIYLFNSSEPTLCSNVMHDVGRCLVFEGSCPNATIRKQDFSNCYDGYVLRNNGLTGPQGDNVHPFDCRWLGGFVNSETFTENTFNCNIHSPIWVRSTSPWDPTNNGSNVFAPYIPNVVLASFIAAACAPTPPIAGGGDDGGDDGSKQLLRQQIAQDEIGYVLYPDESKVANQKRLFAELDENPVIMQGDSILEDFYFTNANGNLGYITTVDEEVAQGNPNAAENANNGIYPMTNSEWNQQQFNAIFLITLMQGNDSLTPQQIADLTAIAEQCPNEGGDAVWQARAMLDWVLHTALNFSDSCNGSSARFAAPEHTSAPPACKIFPNPNAGIATIFYDLPGVKQATFEVLDLTGRVLHSIVLDPKTSQKKIELSGIANGPYLYRIIGDGQIIETGKLVMSR